MDDIAIRQVRTVGAIWIVLAPIGWLMAAISTVKDDTFYEIQLSVFTVAAAAGLVFGLAAVFRQAWARLGLIVLSWFAALVFCGPGLVLLGTSLVSKRWELALMALSIASFGLPFVIMALRLQRLGKLRPA